MASAYPPTTARPNPQANGADLLGRHFLEPELGVCVIIGIGPATVKQMPSRAQRNRTQRTPEGDLTLRLGTHYTLVYRQVDTGEEHYSSIDEILFWIDTGPCLQPPPDSPYPHDTTATVTTPSFIHASLQYVPHPTQPIARPLPVPTVDQPTHVLIAGNKGCPPSRQRPSCPGNKG